MPQLTDLTTADPKGLIRESYRIDGITEAECRSIFLDWALSLPAGMTPQRALAHLVMVYGAIEGHPMTDILHEGLKSAPGAVLQRRGGAMGRRS